MAWRIWGGTRDDGREGLLLVGTAEHAKDWAWHHADAVVNCAQYDLVQVEGHALASLAAHTGETLVQRPKMATAHATNIVLRDHTSGC